ncbi:MAG TPA: NADH-dependent [FeFe] hydrogenase, group A6 [bacterium]|nr:NADH-dependent [FeFe] hydrogenase, group A6 [bacterium]HNT66035.1 NADH-dependent [FeFe] hydrogenase, group A6 [bacterium]HOX85532.1 NADH-dependent [FeFe] hydrogenase, group A6 [bacterium]HPG44691.1 NADH-dependent [FeFe] hydrogenase, group A6 [bacterium]HPM99402.1 NADH-dependent [FeFe] hydrogenase, group A6 [bacterium]
MIVTINGKELWANPGDTILNVAQREGIKIPTLCYLKGFTPTGSCRICVVEVEGQRNLVPSCAQPVTEGMRVLTNSTKVRRARKTIIELLIANHPQDCLVCVRNGNCELQDLASEYGVRDYRYTGERRMNKKDIASPSIERDPNKCILCGRCVRVCHETQNVGAIDLARRGFSSYVTPAMDSSLNTSPCVYCGQCITVCPVGALTEKSHEKLVWEAINDPNRIVIAQTAPSVRVALGEEFGMEPGSIVTGKMTAALRRMGVDMVFDTNFGADLTIMEEGAELISRLKNGGKIPLLTSCSPGWVKYVETFYPDLLEHVSTCKSPQEMTGAIIKSFYAQKMNIDPAKIFVVSVMPCTAKKFESQRPELGFNYPDVDAVLTTREMARMIKNSGIDFHKLPDDHFDDPLGESTGAGAIFGATGGVMEAALRTAHFFLTGKEMNDIEFSPIRGLDGVRRATVFINDIELHVAAVSGLKNIDSFLDDIRSGKSEFAFIEVMACPGGCINGGGQPLPADPEKVKKRAEAIYEIDRATARRCSHQNSSIQKLYQEFLGEPNSHKSHELLHTHFVSREIQ